MPDYTTTRRDCQDAKVMRECEIDAENRGEKVYESASAGASDLRFFFFFFSFAAGLDCTSTFDSAVFKCSFFDFFLLLDGGIWLAGRVAFAVEENRGFVDEP